MTKILYVGNKPMKADNVAGTGIVWNGPGDVQEVGSESAVKRLLLYPDVWKVAVEKPQAAQFTPPPAPVVSLQQAQAPASTEPPSPSLETPPATEDEQPQAGSTEPPPPSDRFQRADPEQFGPWALIDTDSNDLVELGVMDDPTLKQFVRTHGLNVDCRKKGDALRQLILDVAAPLPATEPPAEG